MGPYFTVEEANQVLPDLEVLALEAMAVYKRIKALHPQIKGVLNKSPAGSGSRAASQMTMAFIRLEEIENKMKDLGAKLKEPDIGVCDILALHEGRDVYLCWQYGEERIEWWHELHTGFQARRHVSELIQS
ncbi:MAG: DUF2203 domain-containing protein [Ardenticatenaceae bacterium]